MATKRTQVTAACEACRKRKTKCSAERPRCRACLAQDVPCVYKTAPSETHSGAVKRKHGELQERMEAFEELREMIRSGSEDQASQIFRRMRAGEDLEALLRHMKAGELLLQLALKPEIRYRYDFPVSRSMPTFLDQAGNPYMHSIMHDKIFSMQIRRDDTAVLGTSTVADPRQQPAPYLAPYHAAKLVDSNIGSVKASRWTSVTSDDALVQHLLEIYFVYEYPSIPCLHKDLFLSDMIAGREEFCSSVLANAILALACHGSIPLSNRADFWDPSNLAYRFMAESKRLLELEQDSCKLTSVQALLIMATETSRCALDRIGWSYLVHAADMAKRMSLMAPFSDDSDSDLRKAKLITAWGTFTWASLWSYTMYKEPLFRKPPAEPLPSQELAAICFGEVWLQYPLSSHLWPLHHGLTSKAWAELYVVANAINCHKSFELDFGQTITPQISKRFYLQLAGWFHDLPPPLKANSIIYPAHTQLHMWYHNIVLSLYKPLAASESRRYVFSVETKIGHEDPSHIATHAQHCLETLVRLHYLRHGFENVYVFLLQFLNLVGFKAVDWLRSKPADISEKEMLSTLVLCVRGLREQGRHNYITEVVYHLLRSSISPEHIQFLDVTENAEKDQARQRLFTAYVRAEYPVKVTDIAADPSNWRVDQLLTRIKDATLDDVSLRMEGS